MSDSVTWRNILSVEDFRQIAEVRSLVSIAIQSQYSASEKILMIGELFQKEIDASPQMDSFFDYILNPETAQGIWLDWWGKRVGVNRFLKVEGKYQRLDDDFFRFLIFYRSLANIAGASASAINDLLSKLTGFPVFVLDHQDMTVDIVVVGKTTALQEAILANYGLLNRGAGVLANFLILYPDLEILGYQGSKLLPFNQGVINPSHIIDLSEI